MELYACPVRLFTPEVKGWIDVFTLTHEVRPGVGWVRVSLPAAGAVDEQDALTLEALDVIRRVWNGAFHDEAEARRAESPAPRRPRG